MPRFIPNQPITFNGYSQPCLNNDSASYKMLAQGCDKWKLQIDNTPCDGEDGSICDVEMNDVGAYLVNSEFTNASEWTAVDANIYPAFGYAVIHVDAGSNNEGILWKYVPFRTGCNNIQSRTYKLSFEIVNSFIQGSCDFYINADYTSTADSSVKLYSGFPFTGVTEMYVYIPIGWEYITIGLTGTNGDFVRMNNIKLQEVAECWSMQQDINLSTGAAALSQSAWIYGQSGGTGFFTAVPNWNTWSPVTFPLQTLSVCTLSTLSIGDALELTYTITGRTAGVIYPVLGTTAGISRSSNGTFTEYITDDVGSDHLQFWTSEDFDGTISIVSGKLYANCHTFDVIDAYTGVALAEDIEPNYINDKIELVINPCSIPVIVGGEPNDVELLDGCYRIRFNDCCTGESVTSDTVIYYLKNTEHDCTVLVEAWCDDKALGFDFTADFTLLQRLKYLRFSPVYNNTGNDADDSAGRTHKTFAKSQKKYTALFNYADEATNDAINAQANCDYFQIDGEDWFVPVQDIEPDYGPRGKRNLAQIELEMHKKESIIYNRNNI